MQTWYLPHRRACACNHVSMCMLFHSESFDSRETLDGVFLHQNWHCDQTTVREDGLHVKNNRRRWQSQHTTEENGHRNVRTCKEQDPAYVDLAWICKWWELHFSLTKSCPGMDTITKLEASANADVAWNEPTIRIVNLDHGTCPRLVVLDTILVLPWSEPQPRSAPHRFSWFEAFKVGIFGNFFLGWKKEWCRGFRAMIFYEFLFIWASLIR